MSEVRRALSSFPSLPSSLTATLALFDIPPLRSAALQIPSSHLHSIKHSSIKVFMCFCLFLLPCASSNRLAVSLGCCFGRRRIPR